MKISLNWIKDFVDLSGVDIKDLVNRFTLSTAEVEEVVETGKDIQKVIVGKIIKVEKHPESEKLTILKIDTGNGVLVQSVCGAPNVKEGLLIPFAMVGGSNKKIPKVLETTLAGFESNGVCCSEAEIGFSDDNSGLMILEEKTTSGVAIIPGMDIKDLLPLEDTIVEIDNKSLTHRPDLWGHYGIAREIAALAKRPLKPLDIHNLQGSETLPAENVKVEDSQKCFRYSCLRMSNLSTKISPESIRLRLYNCGVRPINLIVDLTNYVMLELGQPMHSFDGKDVKDIVVKSTTVDGTFTTLDEIERKLPKDTLMICNEDKEVAVAGVMGGHFSEISDATDSILLESANFEGSAVRKASISIGTRTEASTRFEKVLDPELTVLSIKRYAKLLADSDSGMKISSSLTDVYPKKYDTVVIKIEKSYIDKYLGKVISIEEVTNILEALAFKVILENEIFVVTVPSFRATKDVTIKADIVEEVARIYGYNNIEPKSCMAVLEPLLYNEERITDHKIKEMLSENYGYSEVHSYLWYDNEKNVELGIGKRPGLRIINSNSDTNEIIRDSMVPSMLYFAQENRKYFDEFKMFEIGSVVIGMGQDKNAIEHKKLCITIASKKKSENDLFYHVKGLVNIIFETLKNIYPECKNIQESSLEPWIHPAKAADILVCGEKFGVIGVLHPTVKQIIDKKLNVVFAEIDMPAFHGLKKLDRKIAEVSKLPEVSLDLSILVDKLKDYDNVYNELRGFENQLLSGVSFVDIFESKDLPEGKKSMTFNFRFTPIDKTLSGQEIDEIKNKLFDFVKVSGYDLR